MRSEPTPLSAGFRLEHSYAQQLSTLVVPWQPAAAPAARSLFLNRPLAEELGLSADVLAGPDGLAWFAGQSLPPGAQPVAQAYAGHQFGGFSPRLGDGRALLLGEQIDRHGRRRDIALKGSGRTPFSRGGDGKAAVGPMLREVLLGEAMHALGIASTRALAVVATGEPVYREQVLPGAVLTRVAASHIRVGTFEYVAARQEPAQTRALADYTINRHYPELLTLHPAGEPARYLALLQAVVQAQADLVAQWMTVGFIHGVMNTDNMTLSGETIDYGPCAFLEAYEPQTVFSSIDTQGRYAFGNQPRMAQWNLARLAETLIPLLGEDPEAAVALLSPVIDGFADRFHRALLRGQRAKLGLTLSLGGPDAMGALDEADTALANDWLALLHTQKADFTLAHRHLADAAEGHEAPLRAALPDAGALDPWLARWRARCANGDASSGLSEADAARRRALALRAVNPVIIARNHRVEEALQAASADDDLQPFEHLLQALIKPFDESQQNSRYAEPAPAAVTACYRTFCGT